MDGSRRPCTAHRAERAVIDRERVDAREGQLSGKAESIYSHRDLPGLTHSRHLFGGEISLRVVGIARLIPV
jgi:hypothetical protein